MLRTGEVVLHHGRATQVKRIEVCCCPRGESGDVAVSVPWPFVVTGRVVVDLTNGCSARGHSLSPASAGEVNEYWVSRERAI